MSVDAATDPTTAAAGTPPARASRPLPVKVFFASPLEAELVQQVGQVAPNLELLVAPDLWPPVRYIADHSGGPLQRTPEQEKRWLDMMAQAEIFFDFERDHIGRIAELAPNLRWVQSTSSGIISYMEKSALYRTNIVVTTAGGVHAVPLAEWVVFSILWNEKKAPLILRQKADHHWERYCGGEALGKTVCILGYGKVGQTVGEKCRALGMRVYGITSRGVAAVPVDHQGPRPASLDDILPLADYLVIAIPGVESTHRLVDRRRLSLLPKGAFIINIGRGSVIEEPAMLEMLQSGYFSGAALDVFEREPLPADSPFWDMPNVLINPHSSSTSFKENARITDLFCENLRRYLDGRPLINVYDHRRGY